MDYHRLFQSFRNIQPKKETIHTFWNTVHICRSVTAVLEITHDIFVMYVFSEFVVFPLLIYHTHHRYPVMGFGCLYVPQIVPVIQWLVYDHHISYGYFTV